MILMLIRTALWGVAIIAAALAFVWLKDSGGGVMVELNNRAYGPFRPIEFVGLVLLLGLLVWLAIKAFGFLIALIRFFSGDETALSRFWTRSRERRGFDALAEGMAALAEGNGRDAMTKARKAERLLDRPGLTRLLIAQSAEVSGNKTVARDYYKQLASDPKTAFVGVKGLLAQALKEGNHARALKLASHAVDLKPRDSDMIATLFDLQCEAGEWEDARRTLGNAVRAKAITNDVAKRREAVLLIAGSKAAEERGETLKARELASLAHSKSPALIPAAVAMAKNTAEEGSQRRAAKILREAWKTEPHPDIAAAFAALEPDETPEARRSRFRSLTKANPDHMESKLLSAELALAEEDWASARNLVKDFTDGTSSARALAIMAAAEKGDGAEEATVRGWLAKAVAAPRGAQWTCTNCGARHADWSPTCSRCDAFDTMDWRPGDPGDEAAGTSAMLPIMAGIEAPATPAEPAPLPPTGTEPVIDAMAGADVPHPAPPTANAPKP